jgi:hypothetical protein
MRAVRLLVAVLSLALLALPVAADAPADGRDDVTVVAVVDGSFQPQHWDFHASRMPQARDGDPSNDLPLDAAPDTWLPDFTTEGLASYERLDLTLDDRNSRRSVASLQKADEATWESVQQSTNEAVHYYWIPDTKVVGAVHFGNGTFQDDNGAHGANTASVSVGNLHGTCPSCVVVLVTYGGGDREAASNWAMSQPWIDVVTNSFGFSAVNRDRLYSGSDVELQKAASERGQTIFFSSGNGQANTFTAPNTTYFSSQEGPDWIVTVGAVNPTGGNYTGAGKPADIASVGSSYPSIGGTTVSGSDRTFGGTSNATPVVAGYYAGALARARTLLDGPRVQDGGVIAQGTPVACGEVRPDCELADGVLTAAELRTRLFEGAVRTPQGLSPSISNVNTPVVSDEAELAAEGHGAYFGRLNGDEEWQAEAARITGPLEGTAAVLQRPAGEREWFVVDSYCRQSIWGAWSGGAYVEGTTPLPGADPAFPLRTALAASCDRLFPPL